LKLISYDIPFTFQNIQILKLNKLQEEKNIIDNLIQKLEEELSAKKQQQQNINQLIHDTQK
jgi:hypothetical protein